MKNTEAFQAAADAREAIIREADLVGGTLAGHDAPSDDERARAEALIDDFIASTAALKREVDAGEHEESRGRMVEPDRVYPEAIQPTRYGDESTPRSVVGRKSFRDVFGHVPTDSYGFRSFEQFVGTVGRGLHHPGLTHPNADFVEGEGESGGYYVPPQYAFQLFNQILEKSIVLSRAEVFPMQSNVLVAPYFDYSNHNSIGGFAYEWLAELQPATDQTGVLRQISLRAKKLAIYTSASLELVQDAGPVFEQKLQAAMTDAAAFGIDATLLNGGNGTGQPLSVLNSPSMITVAAEQGQAAASLLFVNIVKMFARVDPACLTRGVWLAHPSVIPALFRMAVTVEDAQGDIVGGSVPEAFKQTSANEFTLLGRPLIITEKLPILGQRGDIIFADFSRYVVGLRKEISIERNIAAGWQNYSQKFRLIMRLDGTSKDSLPITPLNGDTLSWAVALAAR